MCTANDFFPGKLYNFILQKKYLYNKGSVINENSLFYEYHAIYIF